MPYIWQVYIANIDPCIKVLHVPTISKAIEESKGRLEEPPFGTCGMDDADQNLGSINTMDQPGKTLMYAIVLSAIASLTEQEVSYGYVPLYT